MRLAAGILALVVMGVYYWRSAPDPQKDIKAFLKGPAQSVKAYDESKVSDLASEPTGKIASSTAAGGK